MTEPESKTPEEVAAVQAQLDTLGTGWVAGARDGGGGDRNSYFTASRPASNSHQEVIHANAAIVVQLAKECDARLGVAKPVGVTAGLLGTSPK